MIIDHIMYNNYNNNQDDTVSTWLDKWYKYGAYNLMTNILNKKEFAMTDIH